MNDLVKWLREQLDDDERVALGIDGLSDDAIGDVGLTAGDATVDYLRRFHMDRVLTEVDAKRRVLDEHCPVDPCDAHDASLRSTPCDTLRLLALPYADLPGYREDWRP